MRGADVPGETIWKQLSSRTMRRLAWLFAGALLFQGSLSQAETPRMALPAPSALTATEKQALLGGATVSRPVHLESGDEGSYIGGVSYQVVHSSPDRVLAALADVDALPRALPRTERAALVGRDGRSLLIELTQGKAPFLATYTVRLEQASGGDTVRFRLEPSRPHDVRDVFGYFRVTPFGHDRTLVTLAVALDMGPGLARMLLSERVERIILRAPAKIREYVEPARLVSAR
jgi:hypothetical protein